ncbi:hypothetical protein ASG39_11725 [Rhizobium sp. Leaf371]|uniref:hypothetical protein n=1 Tax=unclassified Rhizobium TaxID=2613769 RepID=UPI00071486A7|nr:hypothetical protein [Rhizobium sp. Leaf371]KQS64605.1 hypothetical protein ASG39_11725 [Rhizobium sp. Leaf371]PYE41670.1 hypothetical protein DFI02_1093 [Rhizobium sp. PP-F2F-G20b]TCP83433.1 hypothetical protein C8J31_1093 [Rhizobium sp. PP-CC-2G-626]TCQ21002.1 hypothetical protein C8J33_107177 [Rhizobium sp. PP-CC-3G-465]
MSEDRSGGPIGPKRHDIGATFGGRDIQRAEVSLMVKKDSGLRATAEITNRGLLSVAVLVSSILLSTAALVHVAATAKGRRR